SAEPIIEERGFGLLGIVPIALRDLGPAQADLAGVAGRQRLAVGAADLDLDMSQGTADRTDFFQLAASLHHGVAAAAFCKAVGIDITCAREETGKGFDPRFGCALATPDHPAHAFQVFGAAVGAGKNAAQHYGRQPSAGETLMRNGSECALWRKIAQDR